MSDVKFSQFADGGEIKTTDTLVGLRSGVNTKFTSPSSGGGPFLLKANNLSDVTDKSSSYENLGFGSTEPIFLTDSDFSGGIYQLTNPCPRTVGLLCDNPGNIIRLPSAQGVESFTPSQGVVFKIPAGKQQVEVQTQSGINQLLLSNPSFTIFTLDDNSTTDGTWDIDFRVQLFNGVSGSVVVPIIVESWNGFTTPVNVTAGAGIDITGGVISTTGSGPSAALASAWVNNNSFSNSFTDAGTFKGIKVDNLSSINVNFVTTIDGSNQVYFQYTGTEAAEFRIGITNKIRTVSNVNPNSYNYSVGIDSGSGFVPIYSTTALMPFVTKGNNELDAILVPYNITVLLNPNDKLYPIINNNGDLNPTNNEYVVRNMLVDIQKVGDVGGTLAGVASLNGLTGIVGMTSPNNTLSIGTSGSNVTLDLNTTNFSSTNGILYFNGTNIINSSAFTWTGSVLTASTTGTSIQSILSTSNTGVSNFAIYRSSRGDQTNGLAAYQYDTAGTAKWISGMFPGTSVLTSNPDDLIFRSFSGSQVVMALGQTSYNVTFPAGNLILSGATKTVQIASLTASQAVVTDSSKNLISLAYDSANTVSTLVQRDGSGNFSAGTITASLSGNATTATSATTATTATNATNGATVSTSTNASFFPLFAASSSNSNQPFNLGTGLTFNPSTNVLTTTGLTLSGLTSGSVIYSGTSGVISQDNTHLFYDSATGGHLYIGANSSSQTFQTPGVLNLYGTDGTTNNSLKFYTTADGYSGLSIFHDAHGNQAINFDSFWNGSSNISSFSGSNFQITHLSNQLQFTYASGIAPGTGISFSTGFILNTSGDVVFSGNAIINIVNKGLQIKGAAVSAGTANASFVSNVVLTAGASGTINNSFVTTACAGFASVSTSGGTPGLGYAVKCNAGSFTVTSTNALDTSTLNVVFIKGI